MKHGSNYAFLYFCSVYLRYVGEHEAIVVIYFLYIFQSFIQLTQQVLQAHKKEMDACLGSTNLYLDMTSLGGEQDKQDSDANSLKPCTC